MSTYDPFAAFTNTAQALQNINASQEDVKASKLSRRRGEVALKGEKRREESGYNETIEDAQKAEAEKSAILSRISKDFYSDEANKELLKDSMAGELMAAAAASRTAASGAVQEYTFSEYSKAKNLGTEEAIRKAAFNISKQQEKFGDDPFTKEEQEFINKGDIAMVTAGLEAFGRWSQTSLKYIQDVGKEDSKQQSKAKWEAFYDNSANDSTFDAIQWMTGDSIMEGVYGRRQDTGSGETLQHSFDGVNWVNGVPEGATSQANITTPSLTGSINSTKVGSEARALMKTRTALVSAKTQLARGFVPDDVRRSVPELIGNISSLVSDGSLEEGMGNTLTSILGLADSADNLTQAQQQKVMMAMTAVSVAEAYAGAKGGASKFLVQHVQDLMGTGKLINNPSYYKAKMGSLVTLLEIKFDEQALNLISSAGDNADKYSEMTTMPQVEAQAITGDTYLNSPDNLEGVVGNMQQFEADLSSALLGDSKAIDFFLEQYRDKSLQGSLKGKNVQGQPAISKRLRDHLEGLKNGR